MNILKKIARYILRDEIKDLEYSAIFNDKEINRLRKNEQDVDCLLQKLSEKHKMNLVIPNDSKYNKLESEIRTYYFKRAITNFEFENYKDSISSSLNHQLVYKLIEDINKNFPEVIQTIYLHNNERNIVEVTKYMKIFMPKII